jgi:hypothetical protein
MNAVAHLFRYKFKFNSLKEHKPRKAGIDGQHAGIIKRDFRIKTYC